MFNAVSNQEYERSRENVLNGWRETLNSREELTHIRLLLSDSMKNRRSAEIRLAFALFLTGMLLGSIGCGGGGGPENESGGQVYVAAASSLQFVLPEIGTAFQLSTGNRVTFSFAASGSISRQVSRGAPIDLFCSADSRFVRELEAAGHTHPGSSATYAFGRLVLAVNSGSGPMNLAELTSADYRVVGMANPDLAPYGRAAKEALIAAGVWESVSEKIVFGENVAQVLAYLARENVSCAFLPRHLARSQELGFTEVDISLYNPIEHVLVVPASAGNSSGGMSFAEFMLGSKSRAILRHNGFRTPDGGNQ